MDPYVLTKSFRVRGEFDDGRVEVSVADPRAGVLLPQLRHRAPEQSVVIPDQVVGPPQASRAGFQLFRPGAVQQGEDAGEATGRRVPRNHQIHSPELDQFLSRLKS